MLSFVSVGRPMEPTSLQVHRVVNATYGRRTRANSSFRSILLSNHQSLTISCNRLPGRATTQHALLSVSLMVHCKFLTSTIAHALVHGALVGINCGVFCGLKARKKRHNLYVGRLACVQGGRRARLVAPLAGICHYPFNQPPHSHKQWDHCLSAYSVHPLFPRSEQ